MNINESYIEFSTDDRLLIKDFFTINDEFINNANFFDYKNIKTFGDLLEEYINQNNLENNDILMLFLAEVRFDQLSYKITEHTYKNIVERKMLLKPQFNKTICKWYQECNIIRYSNNLESNGNLHNRLEQNLIERQQSSIVADKLIVK